MENPPFALSENFRDFQAALFVLINTFGFSLGQDFLLAQVPQSVCTRHGLFLGAAGSPIIRLAMILFYPITKPFPG